MHNVEMIIVTPRINHSTMHSFAKLVSCDVIAQQSNSIIHQLFCLQSMVGESMIAQWYH
jgi:hypothetical protein